LFVSLNDFRTKAKFSALGNGRNCVWVGNTEIRGDLKKFNLTQFFKLEPIFGDDQATQKNVTH